MLQKLRQRSHSESGFTLVELLVVMLIIGLLAAIAIPAFFNQRDKAKDASAKEAVRTAQTAIETYSTDNNGSYAGAAIGLAANNLNVIEPTLNDVGVRATVVSDANSYTVEVDSTFAGNSFRIIRAADGSSDYTCGVAAKGGCPSTGIWN